MEARKLNWQAFPVALIVVAIYLTIGFVAHIWHPSWLIFLAIPLYHWTVDVIQNKRVKGLPTFLAVIVSLVVYLSLGFSLGLWHPTWLIFFLVPIVASLEGFFAGGIRGKIERAGHAAGEKFKKSFGVDEEDHSDIE